MIEIVKIGGVFLENTFTFCKGFIDPDLGSVLKLFEN